MANIFVTLTPSLSRPAPCVQSLILLQPVQFFFLLACALFFPNGHSRSTLRMRRARRFDLYCSVVPCSACEVMNFPHELLMMKGLCLLENVFLFGWSFHSHEFWAPLITCEHKSTIGGVRESSSSWGQEESRRYFFLFFFFEKKTAGLGYLAGLLFYKSGRCLRLDSGHFRCCLVCPTIFKFLYILDGGNQGGRMFILKHSDAIYFRHGESRKKKRMSRHMIRFS